MHPQLEPININYSFQYAPTLWAMHQCRKRIRYVVGPFGSGKSSACCVDVYQKSKEQAPDSFGLRRTRWAIVRNTYPQLRDTTIKTFTDWFPPSYFGDLRMNPTPDYVMSQTLPDGTKLEAEFLFRALDKPDHVKNLLSLELTGAWFNEVREIPKTIFDHMDGRINRYPSMKDGGATWAGILMDTNPCDTDHWLYRLFEEDLPKSPILQDKYQGFHQPGGNDPRAENLPWLPKNYYKDLAIGKDPQWVRVYVDGEYGYVREGKVIYTNYVDSKHCPTEGPRVIPGLPLILGWDFGLTPAAVITQYHPKGKLNVLKELCATDMGVKKLARDVVRPWLVANLMGYRVVSGCDPSGARRSEVDETKSCYKELKEAGFPVKLAWSNALEPRFSSVDNFLTRNVEGGPAFQLDPACTLVRKGFNGEYKRRRLAISGSEMYADAPEKNAVSHPHEALQYACMLIERGIEPSRENAFVSSARPSPPPPAAAFA